MIRSGILSLMALLCVACGSVVPRPSPAPLRAVDYPWLLREPAAFADDFMWEQRLTAQSAHSEGSLRVAVQKVANRMTVVGLTPFATKAFVLTQDGPAIDFKLLTDHEIPFPPRFMLIDIQRTWLPLGDPATHPRNGVEEFRLDGESVRQTWRAGRLLERRFKRDEGAPAGELVITYDGWQPNGMPRLARVDNWWFGYRLDVETLTVRALPK